MSSMQEYYLNDYSSPNFDRSAGTDFLDSNGYAKIIPVAIRQAMSGYAANPNSLSARNAAFQAFYTEQPKAAGQSVGNAEGYNGLLGAINQSYGITPEWMEAATQWSKMSEDERNEYLNRQNEDGESSQQQNLMPGLLSQKPQNNQSALSILWR